MSNSSMEYLEKIHSRGTVLGWKMNNPTSQGAFSFEVIDLYYWQHLAESNWKFGLYIAVLYVIVIHFVESRMHKSEAFHLKGFLFMWNMIIGILSFAGFLRMSPTFLQVLFQEEGGFFKSVCVRTGVDIQTMFWLIIFTSLKFVELFDTIFVLMTKKPLDFLQWYHHVATMTVVWIVVPLLEPVGRWYSIMNNGVHSIMYPYLALKSLNINMPNIFPKLIMALEVIQMLVGFTVNAASLYYRYTGHDCYRSTRSIQLFAVLYGSFIILFGKMFHDVVVKGRRKNKGKSVTDNEKLD